MSHCSMAKINYLWDGSMDKRKVRGLVPCCGQDGYRAQIFQLPIYSNTHLTSFYIQIITLRLFMGKGLLLNVLRAKLTIFHLI